MVSDQNNYNVEFDADAVDELNKLPKKAQSQILKAATKLAQHPRQGNVKALKGYPGIYRYRTGDYRLIYMIEDDRLVVLVIAVGHRKDIYEALKRRNNRKANSPNLH